MMPSNLQGKEKFDWQYEAQAHPLSSEDVW